MEHSFKEQPFLDMLIKKENDQIIADIYHEPTDTQKYRDFTCYLSKTA